MSFKTTVFGKYFLIDRLAVGGMAEVFKAKTFGIRGFERLLVIKRILPHLSTDDEFVEMFIDEAKISVELTHANICQVTDLGSIEENYFIAMEFIDGKDIRAILKKCYQEKKFPPIPLSIHIVIEILKGLDYAHRKADPVTGEPLNVIHRDISPQNIMVSYDGEVKIVDFGIAKTAAKINRTQAGVLKGKFGYMSPEQASGLELDARTDVFSAAIILFECLTGRRLFLGETDFDTLEKIKRCEIPSPRQYNPNVNEELEAVVMRGLAKEPEDRYQSAREMQAALAKIFFTKYPDSGSSELSQFLKDLFSEEIKREKEALKIALDSLPPAEVAAAAAAAAKNESNPFIASGGSQSPAGTGSGRNVPIGSVLVSQSKKSQGLFGRLHELMHTTAGKWAGGLAIFVGVSLGVLLGVTVFSNKDNPGPPKPPPSDRFLAEIASNPPGAELWVGNKKVCNTTPCKVQVEARAMDVKLMLPGYEPLLGTQLFSTDQPRYVFSLEKKIPKLGSIHVKTTPPGAEILLDGEKTGIKTNSPIPDLEIGNTYRIDVDMPGYSSKETQVYLDSKNKEVVIRVEQKSVDLDLGRNLPSGATIYVKDPDTGKYSERGNPIEDLIPGKTYTVKITARGYYPFIKKYTLDSDHIDRSITMKKRTPAMGKIEVGATPWANIYVDGKLIEKGKLGLHLLRLSVGEHTLKFENPEYDPSTITRKIEIKKGKNDRVVVHFN